MSEKETYVAVPVSALHKLEEARVRLWQMNEINRMDELFIMDVSNAMWRLSNTKWDVVEGSK